ncbi:D-sedoheptulose-7-phosphate isomerase [Desulfatibacillum aliphaticivorans]|uniref:D-sedoheptulose-7-phosphate isomerase n=1 Tax=Desulfatibacillum aliphaticivorans TaxID=218208 RepID=UPI000401E141|nr:SIS domain-containing protein [Desulfatibacillum aliphaticivorans]
MKNLVLDIAKESAALSTAFFNENAGLVVKGATMLAQCLTAGGKILIFGNGGSAADSQHIAAEFVNRFELERAPLAAIALTTDTSVLTSIGNDYSYAQVFTKQVQALGKPGDIAWGISTSGTSANVLAALDVAGEAGLLTLLEAGQGGLAHEDKYDLVYSVKSKVTARVQETHLILAHILCGLTEQILYPDGGGPDYGG